MRSKGAMMSLDELFESAGDGDGAELAQEPEQEKVDKESETTSQEGTTVEANPDVAGDAEGDSGVSSDSTDELLAEDKEKKALVAQAKDERRKRQESDRRIDELEKQLQSQLQQKEMPDVFDDQKAFVDSLRDEYKQEISKAKLELAREMMIDAHDDYLEKEELFREMAKDNPSIVAEAEKQSNPVKYLYQQAKKYEQFQQMQDVDSYKQKLMAEVRADIERELRAEQEGKAKASNITPSLAKARATDGDKFQPATLESLFS